MTERQLRWVQQNGGGARGIAAAARRADSTSVGDIVPDVMGPVLRGSVVQGRLLAALEEYAGNTLLDQLAGVGLRGGMLTLEVADSALLYSLRLQWEGQLLSMAQRHVPEAGIHTIRFALSRGE